MAEPLRDAPSLSLTIADHVSMEFRLIAAGRFHMGARGEYFDEEPVHTVEITQPFYLGIYPVTQEQFAVWRPQHENGFPANPQHPAENMDWNEANAFCGWLTKVCVSELPDGYVAGLPSEAQWEHACRLMKTKDGQPFSVDTEYYTGDGEAALLEAGWFATNADSSTQPVGKEKRPTDFGLYDMHGNVDEWCWDDYVADEYKCRVDGIRDPIFPARDVSERDSNAGRVIRGGSWDNSAWFCRAAYRFRWRPVDCLRFQGFRVCLFPGPVPSHPAGTGAESEPGSGDAARRQAAAKSQDPGVDVAEVDLRRENLPKRSAGKKFET